MSVKTKNRKEQTQTELEANARKQWKIKKPEHGMVNTYGYGEVYDPRPILKQYKSDKVLGYLLWGDDFDEMAIAVYTKRPYPNYNDMFPDSEPTLIVWTGNKEIETSLDSPEDIANGLQYLRHCGLNNWQLNELFGFDGKHSDLFGYLKEKRYLD